MSDAVTHCQTCGVETEQELCGECATALDAAGIADPEEAVTWETAQLAYFAKPVVVMVRWTQRAKTGVTRAIQ